MFNQQRKQTGIHTVNATVEPVCRRTDEKLLATAKTVCWLEENWYRHYDLLMIMLW